MVTREDVAKLASVSVTAVSRVVNNSGYVRRDKREAVERAIKELDYRPNPIAVAMNSRKTKQIMFNTSGIDDSYAMELYKGVDDYATKQDYVAVLGNAAHAEQLKNLMVDGLILPNELSVRSFMTDEQYALPLPMVYASYGSSLQAPRHMPAIEADTYHAMELALEYLMKRGHRRIALASPFPIDETNPRCVAYRNTMLPLLGDALCEYLFITDPKELGEINGVELYFHYGRQLAKRMAQKHTDATAVCCFNDAVAIGVINRFHELGVRVPQDMSVVGIDGSTMGKLTYPSLTSVSLSPFTHGQECARILFGIIRGENVSRKTNIPVVLREAQSVATIS